MASTGALNAAGNLSPPEIEGADHHRVVGKGQCHPPEVFGLLVFGGQPGAPGEQKLGPQQPDTLGPMTDGRLDLFGQVDVAHQGDGPPEG